MKTVDWQGDSPSSLSSLPLSIAPSIPPLSSLLRPARLSLCCRGAWLSRRRFTDFIKLIYWLRSCIKENESAVWKNSLSSLSYSLVTSTQGSLTYLLRLMVFISRWSLSRLHSWLDISWHNDTNLRSAYWVFSELSTEVIRLKARRTTQSWVCPVKRLDVATKTKPLVQRCMWH